MLFSGKVRIMVDKNILETFENPCPARDYEILIVQPEFTSVCPKTGHPDFGTIEIRYTPKNKCVELKSLKIYLQGYRNEGVYYERAVNRIMDDISSVVEPKFMEIIGKFTARGGITTSVKVQYHGEK
jgi:7-cyano-7-deazaguanine reductase